MQLCSRPYSRPLLLHCCFIFRLVYGNRSPQGAGLAAGIISVVFVPVNMFSCLFWFFIGFESASNYHKEKYGAIPSKRKMNIGTAIFLENRILSLFLFLFTVFSFLQLN